MNTNSRFAVAIHILTLLAVRQDKPLTSAYIANSVTTNPVVIRRALGQLRCAGLVSSQPGVGGGWRLTREPDKITLLDAYHAVQEGLPFALHPQPNPHCCIGNKILKALQGVFLEAEVAMQGALGQTTVAQVLERLELAPWEQISCS